MHFVKYIHFPVVLQYNEISEMYTTIRAALMGLTIICVREYLSEVKYKFNESIKYKSCYLLDSKVTNFAGGIRRSSNCSL